MADYQRKLQGVILENDSRLVGKIHREFYIIKEKEIFGEKREIPSLGELDEAIEEFYLIYKLRIFIRDNSHVRISHNIPSISGENSADNLLRCAKSHITPSSSPLLRALYATAKLTLDSYSANRRNELTFLRENILEQVNVYDRLDLLTVLLNWIGKSINSNNKAGSEDVIAIHIQILNDGFGKTWKRWHTLPLGIFKNFIILILNQEYEGRRPFWKMYAVDGLEEEYESVHVWCTAFISEYRKKLPKKSRFTKAYIQYCQAYNSFIDEDTVTALKHLCAKTWSKDDHVGLDHDMLLLICTYVTEGKKDKLSNRLLRKYKVTSRKVMDRYRQRITYVAQNQKNLDYYLVLHSAFYKSFAKLLSHRDLFYKEGYHTEELEDRFAQAKVNLRAFFEEQNAPPVQWLKRELTAITKKASEKS